MALFSFLETSVTALRLFKLKELSKRTSRYQGLLQTLEKNPEQILVTILIANSIASVTAAALITNITERVFMALKLSGGLGFSVGIFVGSFSILMFGEVIPKSIAKAHGEKLFSSTLWITYLSYYLLYPLVQLLIKFSNIFVHLFGGSGEAGESVTSEHEIKFLINYVNEKGLLEAEKTQMLQSIFNLSNKYVEEIMIPMADVIMIQANESLPGALETFSKYQYSRLPVYSENRDNVIGMLYQKDLFAYCIRKEEKPIKNLVRPILFVPESVKINQLLREFKNKRMHIGMVINEHGSIIGLVTLEDVLEEIVGEISDEHEQVTEKIIELQPEHWLIDASIDLPSLNSLLKINFEVENAVTLGGFLTEQLQHLPKKGERVNYRGYVFQVQKASNKRVIQVLVFKNADKVVAEITKK
jgi:putative hemolysin